jgi:hypothetical protein
MLPLKIKIVSFERLCRPKALAFETYNCFLWRLKLFSLKPIIVSFGKVHFWKNENLKKIFLGGWGN